MIPGLLVGATVSGAALALDRMALATLRPTARPVERTPAELEATWDEVRVDAGTHSLYGWAAQPSRAGGEALGARPVAVLVHGWTANSGVMMSVARALLAAGLPVVAGDVRGHGHSDRVPYLTVRHYRDDVAALVRFAEHRFPQRPIVLIGHSMGAAASGLVVADRLARVDALALLSCPADLLEVTRQWMLDKGLPGSGLLPALVPFWRFRAGEPWPRLHPELRASDIHVPTLIVQGTSDRRVPPPHADRLAVRVGVQVTRVEGAGHMEVLEAPRVHEHLLELTKRI